MEERAAVLRARILSFTPSLNESNDLKKARRLPHFTDRFTRDIQTR
jgi:hypothetical protein